LLLLLLLDLLFLGILPSKLFPTAQWGQHSDMFLLTCPRKNPRRLVLAGVVRGWYKMVRDCDIASLVRARKELGSL
jgi:hypothetical protein